LMIKGTNDTDPLKKSEGIETRSQKLRLRSKYIFGMRNG
jgi:hypothetical protein